MEDKVIQQSFTFKNSDRIEKNIKSTPIRTKRSRQVSQISFKEGSGEATFCISFSSEILYFAAGFKRKRNVHSKKDAKKGR